MNNVPDPLAEAIRVLRVEYLKDAPLRAAELWTLLGRAEEGDGGALDELRRALHKLAGSGGSYGFQGISVTSRAGEHEAQRVLESGAPVATSQLQALRAMVQGVADELAAASSREVPPPQ